MASPLTVTEAIGRSVDISDHMQMVDKLTLECNNAIMAELMKPEFEHRTMMAAPYTAFIPLAAEYSKKAVYEVIHLFRQAGWRSAISLNGSEAILCLRLECIDL